MADPTLPDKNPSITPIVPTKIGAEGNSGGSGIPSTTGTNDPKSLPPFPGGGGSTPPTRSGTV